MIILAVESNGYVYAYNDKCAQIVKEEGQLHNYTDSTVAITKPDNSIKIYSSNGELMGTHPKDFTDSSNIQGIVV